MEWSVWLGAVGAVMLTVVGLDLRAIRRARRRKPKPPAKSQSAPAIDMESVFQYVNACDRRNWRPVFTLEQFRAIYQAVMADPTIPNTDALPTDRDRVTLYGVAISVSNAPRPPMPEDMLDRDSPIEGPERVRKDQDQFNRGMAAIAARFPRQSHYTAAELYGQRDWDGEELTDPEVQAKRMYPGSYEAHDQPPRSM